MQIHSRILPTLSATSAAWVCLLVAAVFSPAASAVEIVVTTTVDELDVIYCGDYDYTGGTGMSLREAVCLADSNGTPSDTITFAVGTMTINDRLKYITSTIIINGNGATNTIIQANESPNTATQRIFEVMSGGSLTLNDLTLRNGRCAGGCLCVQGGCTGQQSGGAIVNSGTLTVNNCIFSGNVSTNSQGGAIASNGILNVNNSTIMFNSVGDYGSGGGIYSAGTLNLSNSTVTQNSTLNGNGGGVSNLNIANIVNSTISGNTTGGGFGGGIFNNGTLNYRNTIVANSATGGDCYNFNAIGVNIANLVEDNSCSPAVSGDPNLGPLVYNGGPTPTLALFTTPSPSPAIDAGNNANCLATDQRGISRPQNLVCDIGSFEILGELIQLDGFESP